MRFRSTAFGILYPTPGEVAEFPYLFSTAGGYQSIRRLGDILLPGLILVRRGFEFAEIEDFHIQVRGDEVKAWVQIRTRYDRGVSSIILTDFPKGLEVYLFGAYCTPERFAALRGIGFRRT